VVVPDAEGVASDRLADEVPDEASRARWLYEVIAGADRVRPRGAAASGNGQAEAGRPAGAPPAASGEPALPEEGESPAAAMAHAGGVVLAPVPLADNPVPPDPAMSRRRGEEGLVVVRVRVRADGTAGGVSLAESSGHPRLDEAALAAVAGWRFRPAERDGVAVDHDLEVPLRFVLRER
jgi:TonB family protein